MCVAKACVLAVAAASARSARSLARIDAARDERPFVRGETAYLKTRRSDRDFGFVFLGDHLHSAEVVDPDRHMAWSSRAAAGRREEFRQPEATILGLVARGIRLSGHRFRGAIITCRCLVCDGGVLHAGARLFVQTLVLTIYLLAAGAPMCSGKSSPVEASMLAGSSAVRLAVLVPGVCADGSRQRAHLG